MKKDTIKPFKELHPENELMKKYDVVLTCRQKNKIAFMLMTQDLFAIDLTITLQNTHTLGSHISLTAYKKGVRVPLGNKILNSNNGLIYFFRNRNSFWDADFD